MKRGIFRASIGVLSFLLICGVFNSKSLANSTSGAPIIMCMDCHTMPKGAEIKLENLPKFFQPGVIYEMILKVESTIKSKSDMQGGFSVRASYGELIVSDPKTNADSQWIYYAYSRRSIPPFLEVQMEGSAGEEES